MFSDIKLRHAAFAGETWIGPSVQKLLVDFRQLGSRTREAGGILLGYRRGPHLEVAEASAPMARDVRRHHGFERKDPGHQALSDRHWEASGGTMDYLGDWHTHPARIPSPSSIDRREWEKLHAHYRLPLVFVIVGTHEWYVEVGAASWRFPAPGEIAAGGP